MVYYRLKIKSDSVSTSTLIITSIKIYCVNYSFRFWFFFFSFCVGIIDARLPVDYDLKVGSLMGLYNINQLHKQGV